MGECLSLFALWWSLPMVFAGLRVGKLSTYGSAGNIGAMRPNQDEETVALKILRKGKWHSYAHCAGEPAQVSCIDIGMIDVLRL